MKRYTTGWILALVIAALFCQGCATLHAADRPFTIVVMPDTQNYADAAAMQKGGENDLRDSFFRQTEWIKENQKELNIVMVAHAGDVTQTDHPDEWAVADIAFQTLDGGVPYILCLGNHDIGRGTAAEVSKDSRRTNLNTCFPPSRLQEQPNCGYAGSWDGDCHNYALTFQAGGMDFLVVSLEYKPRDEALAWANKVVAAHPQHRCIVLTHGYLDAEGRLYDASHYKHVGNGGVGVWEKLVKRHENVFLVLCGHVLGESRRTDPGEHGNPVHQLLADYQGMPRGGDGYLRIMTFVPQEDTIQVRSYSPTLDKNLTRDADQFSLEYPMN